MGSAIMISGCYYSDHSSVEKFLLFILVISFVFLCCKEMLPQYRVLFKGPSHLCLHGHFSETENELTMEVGGYQHVMVLKNIKVVDGDIVEALQQLPRGTTDGDCIH